MIIDKDIRRLIVEGAEAEDMEDHLRERGKFVSLQERAKQAVLAGVTTIEEYNKIAVYTD